MIFKSIKFSAHKEILENKVSLPEPIKYNLPDWYKKLEHTPDSKTIKGCVPFLESLINGYVLKTFSDFRIKHNIVEGGERYTQQIHPRSRVKLGEGFFGQVNLNFSDDFHDIKQVKGSPMLKKNNMLPIHKILNPFHIKTPPGYSCLFLPPMNNTDDRFSIIPGIVNTDTFKPKVNFPIVINGDKYPYLDEIIKAGTPYVQIIPFKRDDWKMSITEATDEDLHINEKEMTFKEKVIHTYRSLWWRKTTWN